MNKINELNQAIMNAIWEDLKSLGIHSKSELDAAMKGMVDIDIGFMTKKINSSDNKGQKVS